MSDSDQNRTRTIRFRASQIEEREIKSRAALSGLVPSAYLRAVAMNTPIKSSVDLDAADRLEKVNADLGRVAGLLKLWLVTKKGQGAKPSEVEAMMISFRELQSKLTHIIGAISYDR